MAGIWQLTGAAHLRPEAFGGMAFQRERGVTLELDAEAYKFLLSFLAPGPLPPADHPAAHLVPQLARLGFLCPTHVGAGLAPAQARQAPPYCRGESPEPAGQTLSAPETVHLAVTGRCNLSCPGCYVPPQNTVSELTAAEWCGLIDRWADLHVFQLAVGGGEPLLYEGLYDLLAYARQRGIVPSLTTNGTLLTTDGVRRLERAGVAKVNVSWNGPGAEPRPVERAVRLLLDSTMQTGVNVLATRALLPHLPELFAHLHTLGVRRVTILRPKPPAATQPDGAAWYDANRLRSADLQRLRGILTAWRRALALEVDCALTGLMDDLPPAILRQRGIYGCAAGRRICTVWPDGRVTPCSFLADRSAGDVRRTPFAELWQRGQNWEALRDPLAWAGDTCTVCDSIPPTHGFHQST